MSVVAVVGAQWGDEGKGKIVELVARDAALIAHWAGGYHSGQSLVVDGERLVFRVLPSSELRQGKSVLLGQGMAIDPRLLLDELDLLDRHGSMKGELLVDSRAQVVLPHHIELDRLRAEAEGASGGPRHGLGPAYGDEVTRRGVRMCDLLDAERLRALVEASIDAATPVIEELDGEVPDLDATVDGYAGFGERLRARLVDGSKRIGDLASQGALVVLEGPYGTMVDLDHGSYPYVVGASTVAGGACVGTGIAPLLISRVIGVAKAYATRAGAGPLPSEVTGALAQHLSERGGELSPSSARARRCGMFDVAALRYAVRVNGLSALALTKLDVLSGLESVPLCVGYELDGEVFQEPPLVGLARVQPLVETLPGWTEPLADCRSWDDLPAAARRYVETIEQSGGVKIEWIGVGSDRSQTIVRS